MLGLIAWLHGRGGKAAGALAGSLVIAHLPLLGLATVALFMRYFGRFSHQQQVAITAAILLIGLFSIRKIINAVRRRHAFIQRQNTEKNIQMDED